MAIFLATEFSMLATKCLPPNTSVTTIAVRWDPPINGHLKLNIDGSTINNPGISGMGCF